MEGVRSLGEVIRERRLALGLTQEQLAERIGGGVRQAEVSRLERGGVGLPRRRRLERIAAALNLTAGELLLRSGWSGVDAAEPPPAISPPVAVDRHVTASESNRLGELREALERSRTLREQTDQVLQRAFRTAAYWEAPRTDARAPIDEPLRPVPVGGDHDRSHIRSGRALGRPTTD